MNPINWFEIPVTDMDRAKKFYEGILGVEISINEMGDDLMGWFPFDQGGPGASGSLVKGQMNIPSKQGTMVYFSVEEISDVLERVRSSGGSVVNEKFSIGEHGFCAHFDDTEGNRVALHQAAE